MSTMGDSPDERDDDIAQRHIFLPWVPSARTAASPFLAAAELTGIKRRWSKSDRCCMHHMPSPYEPKSRDSSVPSIDQTTSYGTPAEGDAPESSVDQTTSYGTSAERDAPESSVDQTTSYGTSAEREAPESSVDQTTSYGTPAEGDAPESSVDQITSYGTPAEGDAPESSIDQTTSYGTSAEGDAPESSVDQTTSYGTSAEGDAPEPSVDQMTSHGAPAGRAASDSSVDKKTSTPVGGDGPLLPVQNTSHGTTEDTHPPRRREMPDAGAMSHKGWMSHVTDQDVVAMPSQEQGLTVNVYNITNSEGIHVTQERIVSKGRLFEPDVSPSAAPVGHDMTTRWNQKDNPSLQSRTDTHTPHCSNSKSQLKGQQIHHAKEEDTSRSPKLKRISDRTQQLLLLTDKELFTPTKALSIAKQSLLELGVVLVTGRSGDGKTTLCYRVLKDIANIQHRTPLIITTADDWKYIPPRRHVNNISEDEKYVVFIDDIFGRTNLSREDLRMWERELPIMWPSVESGQVFLLLASRGNIYKQCQQGLKTYKIFSALKEVGLNTDIYGLNVKEKMEMLEAYLNRRTALKMTYDEMRQAVKTSNELGFPQICRFYISSREAQKRGVEFFSRPLQYLMDEVNTLREFDPQAYGVLLLLAFEEGVIKQSHVDPFSSKCGPLIKNWELIRSLCNISPEFGLGDVCNVAKRLCGMYLSFAGGYYRFSHQSIHETIVLEFTSKYPGKGIEIAPINIIVEFVRTAECEDKTATSILLSEDYYKDFAVRIIQLLKSRNSEKVMDHSVLRNDTFLRYFHSAFSEDDRKTLCSTTVPSTYTNIGAYSVFSNDYITANYQDKLEYVNSEMQALQLPVPELYITSVLFAKGLQSIATMLTPSSFLGCGIDMNMFLASSAFVGDLPTVERLLDSGIVPNETCVLAALLSLGDNENVLRKILCHHQAPLLDANMLLFSLKFAVHCNRVNTLKVIMKSIVNHQAKEKMVDIVAKLFFVQMSAVHGCVPLNLPVTVASEHEHKSSVDTFHVLVAADAALDFPKCLSFVSQTTDIELLESITCEIRKREKGTLQYQQSFDRHNDLETDCSETSSPATCPEFHLKSLINSKDEYGCTPLHNAAFESSAKCVQFLLDNSANPNSETITLETTLHEAARTKKDRLSKMEYLLRAGADVNAADIGGCTPLHALALKGNLEEFQYLLLKGAKMNADSLGQTPLHRAASAYTVDNTVIQLLVENIGDINHSDYYGCTPLIYIAGKGSFATLKHAIEKGADVKAKTRMGKTALHESVLSSIESVRKAELLLQHGCGINEISEEGFTPLLCTAQKGTFDSLKLLVDNQGDVSVKDNQGQTALHLLPHYSIDEAKKISYLLKAGADINAVDDKGATPLHVAAAEGCLASVEPLIKYKADISSRDTDGLTVLHRAAQSLTDSEAIIELLIAKGANVNMRDNSGLTAICHAAEHGTLNSLQILVANGADMFVRSSTGETVLHMAVKKYHMPLEKVEFLMERGVNVNLLDCSGTSPLHYAALETSYETVKFLVENGANIQCANDSGTTPLHNAVESTINRKQKVEFLIKQGADVFAADKNGDTPLHVATDGSFELLELLIVDLNIDISNTDKQGNTLLYRAAMSSRDIKSKALLLLDKGADINATGKHGWSLIHWAICLGSGEDLEKLLERGARASSIDEDGSSLLHKAVKSKTDALIKVQLLLKKGLSPNQLDGKGCTPLHIAAKEGLFQIMMILHENGCSVNVEDYKGHAPMHDASVAGDTDCVEYLAQRGATGRDEDAGGGLA
ncbi:uncharacterized protein [Haliotis cracherodii]|uniref:uncharacterized protein n=1 Tax=Haliotis cracherodii TaxID=6455 RepID=UPI0039E9ADF8